MQHRDPQLRTRRTVTVQNLWCCCGFIQPIHQQPERSAAVWTLFKGDLSFVSQPGWHFFVSAEWQWCFQETSIGIFGAVHSDHSCQRRAVEIGCCWSARHWQCLPTLSPKSISNWTLQQQSILSLNPSDNPTTASLHQRVLSCVRRSAQRLRRSTFYHILTTFIR